MERPSKPRTDYDPDGPLYQVDPDFLTGSGHYEGAGWAERKERQAAAFHNEQIMQSCPHAWVEVLRDLDGGEVWTCAECGCDLASDPRYAG